jgi:hypothetical protein
MALASMKAYFHFAWIHPDLAGAFGFYVDEYYCLATAMVFSSNTSARSWEPFWRSIETMLGHYANRLDLVSKHHCYLDMILWAWMNGDACLHGAGEYLISLGFWWHLEFPDEVKKHMLLHKSDNADDMLISINVLEFVMVSIIYCMILHIVATTNVMDNPHLVVLNITNNRSMLNWTLHACKTFKIGWLLAHLFCSLLINSPVRIIEMD